MRAYALYHPDLRQFVAAPGNYRKTGVLAQARLWDDPERAETARWYVAPGDSGAAQAEWEIVEIIAPALSSPTTASSPQEDKPHG